MLFLGEKHAVPGMRGKNRGGNIWIGICMRIDSVLILTKVTGSLQFADIMIISAGPCKKRVGTDFVGSGFSKIRNNNRMMIGTRGLNHQALHKRVIRICDFKEPAWSSQMENTFKSRLKCNSKRAA